MGAKRLSGIVAIVLALSSLSACSLIRGDRSSQDASGTSSARFLGDDGAPTGAAAAVNRYLWAATLETLDFMPLEFADPYGGLIATDWYANPEEPAERFRANIYILDSRLRADALRVSLFKQVYQDGSGWIDASASVDAKSEIENAILTRARELRLDAVDR